MSDPILATLIVTIGGVCTSLLSIIAARIGKMQGQLDGRLTELIEINRRASHAEGKLEGEKNGKEY
jgi:hypothetical protein